MEYWNWNARGLGKPDCVREREFLGAGQVAGTYELGDELRAAFQRQLVDFGRVLVLFGGVGLVGGCHFRR